MASGRLVDYLGHGNIADRPATPSLTTDAIGVWWSDDTSELSVWDGSAWQEDVGGGGIPDLDDLGDVDTTGVSDLDVLTYDAGTSTWIAAAAAGGGGGGAVTYLSTQTVTGSPAATVTFGSLDLTTDGSYIIEGSFTSASGSITDFRMYVNGDSTGGNYQTQIERAISGTIVGTNSDTKLTDLNASAQLHFKIEMNQFNTGHPVADAHMQEYYSGPSLQVRRAAWMRISSGANVTSITLAASGNFAVGSVFKLFKRTP